MSRYDQLALSSRPKLYLSAPEATDKSGTSDFPLGVNNLSSEGQPIIFGNPSSFYMSDSTTVEITGNPLFFNNDSSFECVVVTNRPNDIVPILMDDNSQNAVLITPDGFTLKLFFENSTSTYSKTATVPVKNWDSKFHLLVTITDIQATLSVNGESSSVFYEDTIIDSSNIEVGGGSGFSYLIDGIGFYGRRVVNKSNYINDLNSGYSNYAAQRFGGITTRFEGYTLGYRQSFTLADFIYAEGFYTLIYNVSSTGEGLDYIVIRCNDETVNVSYDIDLDAYGEFYGHLLLDDVDDKTIRMIVAEDDIDAEFEVSIAAIEDSSVTFMTPAELTLEGMALYGEPSESIVNFSDGTKLESATYTGTWIYGEDSEDVPKTVEIVFRPVESENDTYVFYSSDGSASFGSTGSVGANFTAYLNGVEVTDLTTVKYNQWNHLVLVDATAEAVTFYLNSDDGLSSTETISYMLLTGYQDALSEEDIVKLYGILVGSDVISIQEPSILINEGTFSNGLAFNSYSHTWAIVGGGGS